MIVRYVLWSIGHQFADASLDCEVGVLSHDGILAAPNLETAPTIISGSQAHSDDVCLFEIYF